MYCRPLFSAAELANKPVPTRSELQDAQIRSLVDLHETGDLEIFLKVQPKDRWIISDPLPIFENLNIQPFKTELLVSLYLSVGDRFTGEVDFSILWNVADPLHQKILRRLASSSAIPLYFFDEVSLSVIGGKLLRLPPWTSATVAEAFRLNATLPTDEQERCDQLSLITLGQHAAHLSISEKMGICPTMAVYLSSPSKSVVELSEHIKNCSLCQRPHNL